MKHQSLKGTVQNLSKMKSIVLVALALVAVAAAVPVEPEPVKILRSEFDQKPEGSYTFGFETEDGVSRNEEGVVKEVFDEENKPQNVVVVRGSYSYTNPEGGVETINYSADEEGFHPEGPSIPKVVSRR